jgi:hypothetical protein
MRKCRSAHPARHKRARPLPDDANFFNDLKLIWGVQIDTQKYFTFNF